jgi:hypothetical protein
MASAPGFVAVFSFPYRGADEEWSQKYHLDDDFTDVSDFHATFDAFVTAVKPLFDSGCTIIRGYGYHDTDDNAFDTYTLSSPVTGTRSLSSEVRCPGDAAWWIRWNTERTNSRGRTIYLRKYFHPAYESTTLGLQDTVPSGLRTAAATFATNATGTGWNGKHLAGPDGNVPGGGNFVSQYNTTRTLHRR